MRCEANANLLRSEMLTQSIPETATWQMPQVAMACTIDHSRHASKIVGWPLQIHAGTKVWFGLQISRRSMIGHRRKVGRWVVPHRASQVVWRSEVLGFEICRRSIVERWIGEIAGRSKVLRSTHRPSQRVGASMLLWEISFPHQLVQCVLRAIVQESHHIRIAIDPTYKPDTDLYGSAPSASVCVIP